MGPAKRGAASEKILIALDESEDSWRAVEYVAARFGRSAGVSITLLHILPDLPPEFWDIGHFLGRAEQRARERGIAEWEKAQEMKWTGLVRKARARLVGSGIRASAVRRKFVPGVGDAAAEIVDEARKGGYSTIVIGRGGKRPGPSSLLGGNADRVVRLAWDLNVIVAGAARP
jgi:nucleotide-binding universal stress UspA family protein